MELPSASRPRMRCPYVQGEVATGGRGHPETRDEGQKTRASSSILWKNYWARRVGKIEVFWFCRPVEDLGGQMAVRKRQQTEKATPACRAAHVHSKTPLNDFTTVTAYCRSASPRVLHPRVIPLNSWMKTFFLYSYHQ